ncbi:ABC-type Fe3+-hydroxamate transport system substrate-binding protein [Streptomyces aurantiacus]|uniref:helical backbone metal receptor n=1 Tax=Streptomyces aurantiacus TaxID=47760 RepID=UPI00278D1B52|nr:helical backbone metal receptor [Streptomyces aurantiacus]MDQ0778741.1 ABC-type Fe3+-hydroxamate transport system substrate-binding protein [Streptomyces aurantiacus]
MAPPLDDMGTPVHLPRPPRRVVSLVPSLTEAIAHSRPGLLVGATDWCTHPGGLDVTRVRGTKNPDRKAVAGLRPDLVIANKEENRELDVARLRAAGVPVWVTVVETLPQALTSLRRMFTEALGGPAPDWLDVARTLWAGPLPDVAATVAVPIWRDPWMVVGRSTFTGDLLRRAGLANAFASHPDRYPHMALERIDRPDVDLVLLPDEPYAFSGHDGPEVFHRAPTRLVSGRLITWYGPSLLQAHAVLRELAGTR